MKWKSMFLAFSFATSTITATAVIPHAITASAKTLSTSEKNQYKNGQIPGSQFKIGATLSTIKKKDKHPEIYDGVYYKEDFIYHFDKTKVNNKDKVQMVIKNNAKETANDLKKAFGNPVATKKLYSGGEGDKLPQSIYKAGKYYILLMQAEEMESGKYKNIIIGTKTSMQKYVKSEWNWKVTLK